MRILFAGDTHRNVNEAKRINQRAEGEEAELIIQVGDFAFDYDQREPWFLWEVTNGPVPWWFIRGNHDDTNWLREHSGLIDTISPPKEQPIEVYPNAYWCPDGMRAELGGLEFLFVGGAFSVDRLYRTINVSYWEDELTPAASRLPDLSPCDVLVSHDVPAGIGAKFEQELAAGKYQVDVGSQRNRDVLREIYDEATPRLVIHGHYHHYYREENLIGLACDGMGNNMVLLDTEEM